MAQTITQPIYTDHPEMHRGKFRYRRDGLLCALLMAACFLLAWPFAEMGFIDDWSYIKTAQVFVQTGHFTYNGWATATLGWQVLWGALFSRLFGFSFVHVRLSTLPIAVAVIYLFHQILIRFGISRSNAAFGTLALALSPVFMALSASYMTDIPGLFCTLLCLYLCQRSLAASTDRAALAWLSLAIVSNVVGGTARQTIWLGTLLLVPSTIWLFRRRRNLFRSSVLFWLVGVAGAVLSMFWLTHQPYFLPDNPFPHGPIRAVLKTTIIHEIDNVLKTPLCLVVLVFPLLAAWFPLAGSVPRRLLLYSSVISSILLTLAFIFCYKHEMLESWTAPWLTHVIVQMGIPGNDNIPGSKPGVLHYQQRVVISVVLLSSALIFFLYLFNQLRQPPRERLASAPIWRQMFYLLAPYTIGYVGAIFLRGLIDPVFDRYLLILQAIAIIFLLRYYQDFVKTSSRHGFSRFAWGGFPLVSYLALLGMAYYSIAGVHDWFALNRARVQAAEEISRAGIPRTAIQGGFEYDGWTQLEAGGYINDARIKIPPDAFHKVTTSLELPAECTTWFPLHLTPAVKPRYFIVFAPLHCFAASPFPSVTYHTWMPPFSRQLSVQQLKD